MTVVWLVRERKKDREEDLQETRSGGHGRANSKDFWETLHSIPVQEHLPWGFFHQVPGVLRLPAWLLIWVAVGSR